MGALRDTVSDPKHPQYMATTSPDPTLNNVPFITKLFPLWSYMNPIQGTDDNNMIGRSLTAKYLTARVHFEFPKKPQVKNPRYYLIHGWVTQPPGLTQFTNPTKVNFTRSAMLTHLHSMIVEDFNNDSPDEFLDFKEKQNKNYKVLGYRRIKPTQKDLQVQPEMLIKQDGTTINPDVYGSVSPQNHVFKFPLNNRKIRYTKGLTQQGVQVPFLYPNDKGTWIPFLIYYCPDTDRVPQDVTPTGQAIYPDNQCPTISYDNKIWFSDS